MALQPTTEERENFRAEVLETIKQWDEAVSNTQQDDMPGFVRQYTPDLIKKIQEL